METDLKKVLVTASEKHLMTLEEVQASHFDGLKRYVAANRSPDLMFLNFILLHEGANLNGDYFVRDEMEQLWPTYVGKPITWEHGQPYIGFITDSMLVQPEEDGPDPRWYIECAGIVWKARYPDEAYLIAQGAKDGSYGVSMEVYFSDALYAIGDTNRLYTEEEAPYLVKLRGRTYQGQPVYRILLGCLGGGAGITNNPADTDALILAVARQENIDENLEIIIDNEHRRAYVSVSEAEVANASVELTAEVVDESSEKEVLDAMDKEKKLEVAEEAVDKPTEEATPEPAQETNAELEELRAQVAALDAEKNTLLAEKAELQAKFDNVVAEFEAYKKQVETEKAEAAKDALAKARLEDLKANGVVVTEAKASKWFVRLREMDEETYADFKELLTEASQAPAKEPELPEEAKGSVDAKEGTIPLDALNLEQKPTNGSVTQKFERFWERVLSGEQLRKL